MYRNILIASRNPEAALKCRFVASFLEEYRKFCDAHYIAVRTDELPKVASSLEPSETLVLSVGGDGTLLRVFHRIGFREFDVLPVGMGTVNFFAEVLGVEDGAVYARKIAEKDFILELVPTFEADINGEVKVSFLNDLVIRNVKPERLVNFKLIVEGECIVEGRGDGLIVSSSIGTPAYALSAGGVVVDPQVAAMIITPLAPYTQFAKATFVVHHSRKVELETSEYPVTVVADGIRIIDSTEKVRCRLELGSKKVRLVRFGRYKYFAKLRKRLVSY